MKSPGRPTITPVASYARRPRAPPSEFVSVIWAVDDYVPGPHRHERVMPSAGSGIIIPLRGGFPPIFNGPHSRSFVLTTSAQVAVAGAVFRPGGASPMLAVPLTATTNQHVALED